MMGAINEVDASTYADKFNIVSEDYRDISIKTLPFSVRVINSFLRNGIHTLDILLNSTPEDLMRIKGFGKTCLDEVDGYCSSLSDIDLSEKSETYIEKTNLLPIIKSHKNDISLGDFSFVEEEKLSENELLVVKKYEEAFAILGPELAFDCVTEPQKIFDLINMFSEYQNKMKRHNEVWQMAYNLPKFRLSNKASAYIRAFTVSEDERKLLYGMCPSENSSIYDMLHYVNLDDNTLYLTLRHFLKWCKFDLLSEVDSLFNELYTKDTYSTVIKMRAKRKTLEEIGSHLGVTRERVRQIESKIKRKFNFFHGKNRIISKISADRNGDTIITPVEIAEYCGSKHEDLIYLLQASESPNYTYDRQLDIFILGSDSLKERINNYIEGLPDIIKVNGLKEILDIAEESGIPSEMLERAIVDSYRCTGEVYHRCRLSLATIYERVLDKYYPDGFKAYDTEEIEKFRQIISEEYGDVGLPEHDRALTARVASICILCGRGIYRLKNKSFISKSLADKIYRYINGSESTIFLTNSLFAIFEKELLAEGIDNKYFLQGVLRELFGDKFFFKRDYITKDFNVTSFYSEVVAFIKKSDFPVSKQEIQKAFPGITEIVINFSVDDPNVLNYFGEYLHATKLRINPEEKIYLHKTLKKLVADGNIHHSRDVYDIISRENPEVLTRNAALYPFSAYSILEFLFRDEFQFMRPYIAKNGTEISRTAERLHDFIYTKDEITVSQIGDFARDNHFQIQSLLEYVNSCNDEYLLVNDDLLMRICLTGVDEMIAEQVDNIIANEISETEIISDLNIWQNLPSIKIPWNDWLIYSIITKWGKRTVAGTSSNQFRLSVPIVAPVDKFDADKFAGVEKSPSSNYFEADNLDNIDALLEDIIDDSFLQDFSF